MRIAPRVTLLLSILAGPLLLGAGCASVDQSDGASSCYVTATNGKTVRMLKAAPCPQN